MLVSMCDRQDCTNVMCDRLSQTYGYICSDCFEELKIMGLAADILAFMESPRLVGPDLSTLAAEKFEREFPLLEKLQGSG